MDNVRVVGCYAMNGQRYGCFAINKTMPKDKIKDFKEEMKDRYNLEIDLIYYQEGYSDSWTIPNMLPLSDLRPAEKKKNKMSVL